MFRSLIRRLPSGSIFILVPGVIVLLVTALNSHGFYNLDEHFQILEFASLISGNTTPNQLPWEYDARIRPSLQPWIAYSVINGLQAIGFTDPFDLATVLRCLTSCLSIITILFAFRNHKLDQDHSHKKVYLFLGFFLWFLPFLSVRFSSEIWSGLFFTIGTFLLFTKEHTLSNHKSAWILSGLFMGFAFLLRFQIAIAIMGLFMWILVIKKVRSDLLFGWIVCGLFMVAVGILLDRLFYGTWVLTPWEYFQVNLLEGKAAEFGTQPIWFYLTSTMGKAFIPIGVVVLGATFYYWVTNPKDPITWFTIPFFVVHSLIGHKEVRFLFPMVFFLPTIISRTVHSLRLLEEAKRRRWVVSTFLCLNMPLLIPVMFTSPGTGMDALEEVYDVPGERIHLFMYRTDPFHTSYGLPKNFYIRERINAKRIENARPLLDHLDASSLKGKTLLLGNPFHPGMKGILKKINAKRIHQTIPEWITDIKFNGWTDRTKILAVYLVTPKK